MLSSHAALCLVKADWLNVYVLNRNGRVTCWTCNALEQKKNWRACTCSWQTLCKGLKYKAYCMFLFFFHSFIYCFSSTVKHLLGHISSPWSKETVERLLNRTRAERGWRFLERLEIWLALDRMINIKPTFCHDGVKTAKSWKCDGWIMRRVIKGLSHMLLVLICFV